ncbi:Na+:solute symporter [candidate division KSB1 bacterium]|nr:Na+:solute symporter [candidate division KSB1 bacterium]
MTLTTLDWIIILGYIIVALGLVGIYVKRASKGTDEYFAAGRSLPWWLLGTSMVATTFSTDTPNLITNLIREKGIAYNWIWWAFLLTGMMTVFFYARLWRRSRVLTDLEFYEIRYSGKSAAWVRGFRAIYLGLFFNCVILATVTLSAAKITNILFGWTRLEMVIYGSLAAIAFTVLSGLWGVVVTDLIQFAMAMIGSIAAAYYALQHQAVGGLSGLVAKIPVETLSLLPDFSDWELTLTIFIIPLTVQWWSVWYPGAEPGGGSYIAQRMLAAKDERHSMIATLWFNIAHYGIRPWPWILVGLASMLVFPTLQDIQTAFPHVSPDLIGHDIAYPAMLIYLPAGFKGVMVAALFAAYLSTMDTSLNWGASYVVHDFYRRFIRSNATERHYVTVSRIVTTLSMLLGAGLMFFLANSRESFNLLLSIGAGTGLLYLLRWFWWRINAWSEIAAMMSSFVVSLGLFVLQKSGVPIASHVALLINVTLTTAIWITVTFLTRPTDEAVLVNFYKLVRPMGRGWRALRDKYQLSPSPDSLPHAFLAWMLGCIAVYAALFCMGYIFYGQTLLALLTGVLFASSAAALVWLMNVMERSRGRSNEL